MIRFTSDPGDDLKVDPDGFDSDGDLNIDVGSSTAYLSREQVTRLRDLLTEFLGDEKDEPTEKETVMPFSGFFALPEPTLDERVDALPFEVVERLMVRLSEVGK